jgi:hypothetical protein
MKEKIWGLNQNTFQKNNRTLLKLEIIKKMRKSLSDNGSMFSFLFFCEKKNFSRFGLLAYRGVLVSRILQLSNKKDSVKNIIMQSIKLCPKYKSI